MAPTKMTQLLVTMVIGAIGQHAPPPPLPEKLMEQPCDHFDATQWNCTFMQKCVGVHA